MLRKSEAQCHMPHPVATHSHPSRDGPWRLTFVPRPSLCGYKETDSFPFPREEESLLSRHPCPCKRAPQCASKAQEQGPSQGSRPAHRAA